MAQMIKRFSQLSPSPKEVRDQMYGRNLAQVVENELKKDELILAFLKAHVGKVALIGGAIRNILSPWEAPGIKDYDFSFVTGELEMVDAFEWWVDHDFIGHSVSYPKCVELVRGQGPDGQLPAVQLLEQRQPTFEEIVELFDFSICKFAFWWTGTQFKLHAGQRAIGDLATQVLRYERPEREGWAGTSLARAFKFSRMGYNITDLSMAQLVQTTYKETHEQAENWKEFVGHFPDKMFPEDTPKVDRDVGNFIPRFQRGLAYYNKGGSM